MTLTQNRQPRTAAHRPRTRNAVVVGMDGSPHNQAVVSWAMHEAEATARPLNLVAVLNPLAAPRATHSAPSDDRDRTLLHQFATEISRSRPGLRVDYDVEPDGVVGALLAQSAEQGLLVVGRSGPGSVGHAVIGATHMAVANATDIPVVIVPDAWNLARHARQPVVVGADVGDMHADAVAFAFQEARRRRVLLRIVLGSVAASELIDPLRAEYGDVSVEQVVADQPLADALLVAADSAQLLVLGRTGGHETDESAFGATALSVLQCAHVPVAVVPRSWNIPAAG